MKILILILFCISASCQQTSFHSNNRNTKFNPNVVELLGQSNAMGYVPQAQLQSDLSSPITGAFIFNTSTLAFEQLTTTNNSGLAYGYSLPGYFGIELRLMKLLAQGSGKQYLIKYTLNGTALGATSTGTDGKDWAQSSNELFAESDLNHSRALTAIHNNLPPRAIVWMQGENDANSALSPSYQTNLENFISDKRASYKYPKMPFVIVRLSTSQTAYGTYLNVIRSAQNAVAAEANNYLIDTDDLTTQADAVHYSASAIDSIGYRVYNVIKNFK